MGTGYTSIAHQYYYWGGANNSNGNERLGGQEDTLSQELELSEKIPVISWYIRWLTRNIFLTYLLFQVHSFRQASQVHLLSR